MFCVSIGFAGEIPWPDVWFRGISLEMFGAPFVGLLMPALSAMLVRDVLLRRALKKAIELKVERVRCRQCEYILIGQRAFKDAVTCPECGNTATLESLGITEDDLIPPNSVEEEMERRVGADAPT